MLSILATFVHFILNTLACSPKGNIRNYIQDVFILIFTVGSIVCFGIMGENSVVIGTLSIGAYVYLGTQILNVVIDVMTQKQNIEVKHKQCYVGGIPIEEYFEMVESEMKPEDIRQEQYRRLTEIQLQQEAELKRKRRGEIKCRIKYQTDLKESTTLNKAYMNRLFVQQKKELLSFCILLWRSWFRKYDVGSDIWLYKIYGISPLLLLRHKLV